MSTLILVRHGQASFGASDYDRLSETGVRQSELPGIYWAGRGPSFDAAYSGAQQRQQQTQQIVRQAYQRAGRAYYWT
jgi:phosphohistidine phosphatase SixA